MKDHEKLKLFDYLSLCSVGHHNSTTLFHVISGYIDNHGLEWTISRIKSIKVMLIKYKAGQFSPAPGVALKDGKPKGIFGKLWDLDLNTAMRVLNVYTLYRFNKLTDKQRNAILEAVNTTSKVTCWWDYDPSAAFLPTNIIDTTEPDKILIRDPLYWISSESRRTLVVSGKSLKTVPETSIRIGDFIRSAVLSHSNKHFIMRHSDMFFEMFSVPEKARRMATHLGATCVKNSSIIPLIAGKLSYIQERGGKCRHIANPIRAFQALCTPFGEFLETVLKEDDLNHCVFDQNKGITYAQDLQKKKLKLFSVDLSKATDRFPLLIQVHGILELLAENGIIIKLDPLFTGRTGTRNISLIRGRSPWTLSTVDSDEYRGWIIDELLAYSPSYPLDSFKGKVERSFLVWLELVVSSHWYDPELGYLSWLAGQPLGLFPSFFAFTYTHISVLRHCCLQLGLPFTCFMILGDDVIISDERLYELYRDKMMCWNVPVSEDKTIASSTVCEFAGKLIVDGNIVTGNAKYQDFSKGNPFGPLYIFGLQGLKLIPKRFRSLVKKLACLPEPYGLGLNPDGIPLEVRMDPVLDKLGPYKKEPIRYSGSSSRQVKKRMYEQFFGKRASADLEEFIKFRQELDPQLVKEYNAALRFVSSWDTEFPLILQIGLTNIPSRGFKRKDSFNLRNLNSLKLDLTNSIKEWKSSKQTVTP